MNVTRYTAAEKYIGYKYGNAPKVELQAFQKAVAAEISAIKREKSAIYENGPAVHGRFEQSQLDVLDIHENKLCAIFDNTYDLIAAAKQ